MSALKRLHLFPAIATLILCTACNRAPEPGAEKARYQFTTDKSGHTFRLDTVTGEVIPVPIKSPRKTVHPKTAAVPRQRTSQVEHAREASANGSRQPASIPPETAVETPVIAPPAVTSVAIAARAAARLSVTDGCSADVRRTFVVRTSTEAYVKADASSQQLAAIAAGMHVDGVASQGEWRLVRFKDAIWGERAAFVRCAVLELAPFDTSAFESGASPPPNVERAVRSERAPTLTIDPRQRRETLRGYLEWQRGDYVVVEGQRVRWNTSTRLQLGLVPFVTSVPTGYEMVAVGRRARDGSLIAERLEAKPNTTALSEDEIVKQFDDAERMWLAEGTIFLSNGKQRQNIGRIEDTGPSFDRVRRIMNRILPPYLDPGRIRVHVVESDEWNAHAMANGTIWVNTGLLNDVSDDELAVVLGHELAHYTYEHARRTMKNDTSRQRAAIGANAAAGATSSTAAQETIATTARLSLLAWGSGYSRDLEDQADRVGLRYAYEGGFDVERAIDMWTRRSRLGERDVLTNRFGGDHSRPTDRINNIRRELQLNYRPN